MAPCSKRGPSLKSFRRRRTRPTEPPDDPGNPTVNFHGERRSNATHQSTTDPDAACCGKRNGHEAKLPYLGGLLMENRHGLVVHATRRGGHRDGGTRGRDRAGRGAAVAGAGPSAATRTLTTAVSSARSARRGLTPHVARKAKCSAIDGRTTRHPGYAVSQRKRETRRTGLWVDEDGRPAAQAAASRRGPGRLDLRLHRRRVQLGPDADPRGATSVTRTPRGQAPAKRLVP